MSGPASNNSANYIGLVLAQNISLLVSGDGAKTIMSLDLDLYEKAYLLIRSRTDLAEMFIVRLGRTSNRICSVCEHLNRAMATRDKINCTS